MWATKKAAIKKGAQNGRQYQANLRRERGKEREREGGATWCWQGTESVLPVVSCNFRQSPFDCSLGRHAPSASYSPSSSSSVFFVRLLLMIGLAVEERMKGK